MSKQLSQQSQQDLLSLQNNLKKFIAFFEKLPENHPGYTNYKSKIEALNRLYTAIDALDIQEKDKDSTPSTHLNIQQIGDPKTIKPEYKGVNFDYEANAAKIRYYNANLTDGGHFTGIKSRIEGMVFLYKQPTHRAVHKVVTVFPNSQQINEWNSRVDRDLSDINTAKSVTVGIATTLIPVARFGQLGNAILGGLTATVDNKLLSISAKEGGLKSGDSLVLTITTTVIRSTFEGTGMNGVQVRYTVNIQDNSGKIVEVIEEKEKFMDIVAFENGFYGRTAKVLLEKYESSEGSITNVPPNESLPYLIKFNHRD